MSDTMLVEAPRQVVKAPKRMVLLGTHELYATSENVLADISFHEYRLVRPYKGWQIALLFVLAAVVGLLVGCFMGLDNIVMLRSILSNGMDKGAAWQAEMRRTVIPPLIASLQTTYEDFIDRAVCPDGCFVKTEEELPIAIVTLVLLPILLMGLYKLIKAVFTMLGLYMQGH